MLSDTLFDCVQGIINDLAVYYNDSKASYTQDQIEEAIRRLVPIAAMGVDLDRRGDGVPGEGSALREAEKSWDWQIDDKVFENWIFASLWDRLYEKAAELRGEHYESDLPSLPKFMS